jgi:hypothetical protein
MDDAAETLYFSICLQYNLELRVRVMYVTSIYIVMQKGLDPIIRWISKIKKVPKVISSFRLKLMY